MRPFPKMESINCRGSIGTIKLLGSGNLLGQVTHLSLISRTESGVEAGVEPARPFGQWI